MYNRHLAYVVLASILTFASLGWAYEKVCELWPLRATKPAARVAARLDIDRLLRAFERVESGGKTHIKGDGGKSWGLYQFQKPRWIESSGAPKDWGRAPAVEQRRVMRLAVQRYLAAAPAGASLEQTICFVGRCHNGGETHDDA